MNENNHIDDNEGNVLCATDLTIDEQASLTSGNDPWHMEGLPDRGIPAYMLTDGPHGLRKAKAATMTTVDLTRSVPATCFPPASGMANAWDDELTEDVGRAIGEECVQEQVAVILGPAVNIKRNPLGGRCFEYWSEDPLLAGRQASGIVAGIQSQGVGTSVKHFAVNNQETDRMRVSAQVSERALREIYLAPFEYIVKRSRPWTIMCSYNRINGVYASQNAWLLNQVLRDEWGFDGIVMSDWGAVHDRVAALCAGLNLEMPPSGTDDEIARAVRNGSLNAAWLAHMADGILRLYDRVKPAMERGAAGYRYDVEAHHRLARRAATESIVLLKNEDDILPLAATDCIAVIGEFARTPRYQGGGSSHMTPTKLVSFLDALRERGIDAPFAAGYDIGRTESDPKNGKSQGAGRGTLADEAVALASDADKVLLFLGLPEEAEAEGTDRSNADLPMEQIELLERVAAENPNVVVVLSNGSMVTVSPWESHTKALVEGWLLGQAGGEALSDVLFGDVDASGRLAVTIPERLQDDPSYINFPGGEGNVVYGEDVFVGYRYYDTVGRAVSYPFGYGLSYTRFVIDGVQVHEHEDGGCEYSAVDGIGDVGRPLVTVRARVTNVGDRAGTQIVQVYVAPPALSKTTRDDANESASDSVNRPIRELRAYARVNLQPGESTVVNMELDARAFAYWSTLYGSWHVSLGMYRIEVGVSSRDIIDAVDVTLPGDDKEMPLNGMSTVREWMGSQSGGMSLRKVVDNFAAQGISTIPESGWNRTFFLDTPLAGLSTFLGVHGREFARQVLDAYEETRGES